MQINVTISNGLVGCTITRVVDVDDEELEDVDQVGREKLLDEYARDAMFEVIEWSWEEVTE